VTGLQPGPSPFLLQPPHRLLHIGFGLQNGGPKIEDIQPHFDKATDWYRYAPNCWLVWTSGTPDTWFKYLKPFVPDPNYILIIEVNPQQIRGWLPKGGWEWLSKHVKL
jgi:hypothetical protein